MLVKSLSLARRWAQAETAASSMQVLQPFAILDKTFWLISAACDDDDLAPGRRRSHCANPLSRCCFQTSEILESHGQAAGLRLTPASSQGNWCLCDHLLSSGSDCASRCHT